MVTATTVMGVMKMGNSVPQAGIEPIILTFQASVLTITPPRLPEISMLPTPTWTTTEWSVQTTKALHRVHSGNISRPEPRP